MPRSKVEKKAIPSRAAMKAAVPDVLDNNMSLRKVTKSNIGRYVKKLDVTISPIFPTILRHKIYIEYFCLKKRNSWFII